MAIQVGYYEGTKEFPIDPATFCEGPFVIVYLFGLWRIECEVKGHVTTSLSSLSIYDLVKGEQLADWMPGKTESLEKAASLCDKLNSLVREGRIICHPEHGIWYCPDYASDGRF